MSGFRGNPTAGHLVEEKHPFWQLRVSPLVSFRSLLVLKQRTVARLVHTVFRQFSPHYPLLLSKKRPIQAKHRTNRNIPLALPYREDDTDRWNDFLVRVFQWWRFT
ncbi:hypothetical protein [Candidatus Similichlamydia laticola]|uniref:Uncharacterized protein n=1 Tax=Candidatus Similichlamydia laticola TaxID=2170265 RepID=A0A369KJE3_9BACT|nr:hypothetical protein [Candidatus Similichlamydia laticola]RDB31874.1 hypothetical protein HAT2_00012 [Candidatus Similichlamydia laticola]